MPSRQYQRQLSSPATSSAGPSPPGKQLGPSALVATVWGDLPALPLPATALEADQPAVKVEAAVAVVVEVAESETVGLLHLHD